MSGCWCSSWARWAALESSIWSMDAHIKAAALEALVKRKAVFLQPADQFSPTNSRSISKAATRPASKALRGRCLRPMCSAAELPDLSKTLQRPAPPCPDRQCRVRGCDLGLCRACNSCDPRSFAKGRRRWEPCTPTNERGRPAGQSRTLGKSAGPFLGHCGY